MEYPEEVKKHINEMEEAVNELLELNERFGRLSDADLGYMNGLKYAVINLKRIYAQAQDVE